MQRFLQNLVGMSVGFGLSCLVVVHVAPRVMPIRPVEAGRQRQILSEPALPVSTRYQTLDDFDTTNDERVVPTGSPQRTVYPDLNTNPSYRLR